MSENVPRSGCASREGYDGISREVLSPGQVRCSIIFEDTRAGPQSLTDRRVQLVPVLFGERLVANL